MREQRKDLRILTWGLSILWALVFGSLAYIAFSTHRVTLGGMRGMRGSHFEGDGAAWAGFILVVGALAPLDWLADQYGYRRPVRLMLILGWLGSIVAYVAWR